MIPKLFTIILETGIVPDDWCLGIIKPIYKNKGPENDPNNYRGITLLSSLGKLFTSCLNSRLNLYAESSGLLNENQAGFRKGYSTLDHIYSLHSIIEYYLYKKKRLYCAFVDYSKAFDLVDRVSLWQKMLAKGITGKVFNVIYNIYAKAKSCVKMGNQISGLFNSCIGVRQGENLSPLLFAIYISDFDSFLSRKYGGLSYIDHDIKDLLCDDELEQYIKLYSNVFYTQMIR